MLLGPRSRDVGSFRVPKSDFGVFMCHVVATGTDGQILAFIVDEGIILLNNHIFRDKLHLIAGAG